MVKVMLVSLLFWRICSHSLSYLLISGIIALSVSLIYSELSFAVFLEFIVNERRRRIDTLPDREFFLLIPRYSFYFNISNRIS